MEWRARGHRFEPPLDILSEIELCLGAWMDKHGLFLLRIGISIVFFWLGRLSVIDRHDRRLQGYVRAAKMLSVIVHPQPVEALPCRDERSGVNAYRPTRRTQWTPNS
jgi:uncharacterized membrane protein YkgB